MKTRPVSVIEDRLFLQALSVQWTSLLVGATASREAAERRELEVLSGIRAFTTISRTQGRVFGSSFTTPSATWRIRSSGRSSSSPSTASRSRWTAPWSSSSPPTTTTMPGCRIFPQGSGSARVVRGLGWETSPSLPLTVLPAPEVLIRGNLRAFDTTLRNLLLNAREILEEHPGREGPGEIRIEVREEGESVSVVVSDNGPGMTREFIENRLLLRTLPPAVNLYSSGRFSGGLFGFPRG